MTSRRPPLANVPNAANSPHRVSNSAAGKRARPRSQIDLAFGQPPPKRQVVGLEDVPMNFGMQRPVPQMSLADENKLFSRRQRHAQATPFEKRLMAVRDQEDGSTQQHQQSRATKQPAEKLDNIRQWQRHYRKAFPGFVFYFDSLPADVRSRSLREVLALGAVSVNPSPFFLSFFFFRFLRSATARCKTVIRVFVLMMHV
jgi:regulatory subunit for Cdc7p protein kinase